MKKILILGGSSDIGIKLISKLNIEKYILHLHYNTSKNIKGVPKEITKIKINLKDIKISQNECEQQGCPESVMVYPQTTVVNLRYKIFIATGIQPHRQYLVLTNNCNILSLPYSI